MEATSKSAMDLEKAAGVAPKTQTLTFMDNVRKHTHHFTWSWFIWPMATLGLSVLLHVLPYRFDGLTQIGIIIYLFGVTQFTVLLILIIIRFSTRRGALRRSLQRPSETLFFSTVLLAWAALIIGVSRPSFCQ
jgi:tellurite resistance protein TehA-like permease